MKLTTSITINSEASKVWTIFTNPKQMPLWMSNFHSIETIEGEAEAVGSIHKVTFKENGKLTTFTEKVTNVRKHELYAFTMEHPALESHVVVRLKSSNGKTLLSQEVNMKAKKLSWKLLLPLMKKQMLKRQNGDFEKLKSLAEH